MGYALNGGTWSTSEVSIPADTLEDDIFRVAQEALLRLFDDPNFDAVAGCWVHNSMDDDCPDIPRRTEVPVKLCFDMGQVTEGSELEQHMAAVEQINLTLQRQPFGLGAQIFMLDG